MTVHQRRSLYFNEENLYLNQFLSEKKKVNDWVLNLIKQAYLEEKGFSAMPTASPSSPQDSALLQAVSDQLQALSQQVQQLNQQVHHQQQTIQALQTSTTEPTLSPSPVAEPTPTPSVKAKVSKFDSTDL